MRLLRPNKDRCVYDGIRRQVRMRDSHARRLKTSYYYIMIRGRRVPPTDQDVSSNRDIAG